jgi:hypothetical protein
VHPPNESHQDQEDEDVVIITTLLAQDLLEYESFLQFLFTITKGNIPGFDVKPCFDDMFQSTMQNLASKLCLDTDEPLCPDPTTALTTPAGSVDFTSLQNAVDHLASNSSTKKPGWDQLSTNKKQMILHLCSTDESTPAIHPPHDF